MLRNGIEYIYAVYKERSFSHAAEKLFISQPALSTAIQKEESYWHCSFFKRDKIPIELTQEGKYMIEAIEQIKTATRRYAKRQRTWFRKDTRIAWIDADSGNAEAIATQAQHSLDTMGA